MGVMEFYAQWTDAIGQMNSGVKNWDVDDSWGGMLDEGYTLW